MAEYNLHNYLLVSLEGLSLFESNEQIYDFWKRAIFEKQKHCGPL